MHDFFWGVHGTELTSDQRQRRRVHRSKRAGERILVVREEVGRQSREVVRARIRVALAPRSVELEHYDRAAPRFGGRARRYAVDGAVDRRAALQRCRAVPDMEREAQGLAVQPLGKDDGVWHALREPLLHERRRANTLRDGPLGTASHGCDADAICTRDTRACQRTPLEGATDSRLPSCGMKRRAETEMSSACAGGGVAIMFGYCGWAAFVGMHSRLWRDQS